MSPFELAKMLFLHRILPTFPRRHHGDRALRFSQGRSALIHSLGGCARVRTQPLLALTCSGYRADGDMDLLRGTAATPVTHNDNVYALDE